MTLTRLSGRTLAVSFVAAAAFLGGAGSAVLGVCGPFTDVSDAAFCPFVLEVFTLAITTGTTPTTYDPSANVSRLQMAAFLSRTVDGVLNRGSRRAAMRQFWTTQAAVNLGMTTLNGLPDFVETDGTDLWVTIVTGAAVKRVRGSDGKLLETWTGAGNAWGVLSAMGKVIVTGRMNPGALYRIDPSQPPGAVTTVATNLDSGPYAIAYDGSRIWTANVASGSPGSGSVSIVTPGATIPWTVTNVALGFSVPSGILYDGSSIWVTDQDLGQLLKLSPAGAIVQTVTVGSAPTFPAFDGTNIWVPNRGSDSISVVRASSGVVLRTLTGNGLSFPTVTAFDGQRVLVTNLGGSVEGLSLWKAADLTALGFLPTGIGSEPFGACSDGVHFWIALGNAGKLARF